MNIISRIILDGEMLVWDPVSERNLPFGTLKTAALGTIVYSTTFGDVNIAIS
jgi:ATP-dependent DNA ligase